MKPLTTKQRHLLKVVVMGNLDATGSRISNVDVYQLQGRLPYKTTRESLMCSLGILVKQGWILRAGKENRDGRLKQTLEPTPQAIRAVNPSPVMREPEYVELVSDDDVVILELT